MPYNSLITRADIAALNTEQVSTAMLQNLPEASAALTLFARIPVAKSQVRFPVLTQLPTAYWVTGDTGLKQTTEAAWANTYMYVEELAAIVPVPDAVIEDAEFDVQAAIRPLVAEAIGTKLDAAIFFGSDKPNTWPADITTAAIAAGNVYARGTNAAAAGGVAEDINQLMGLVEKDGYDVNGFVANRTFRARIRGARGTDGQKLLDVSNETVEGQRVAYAMSGLWPSGLSAAELITGDFTKGMIGIRRDITFDVSSEAVIQDAAGVIVYNAYQQDLTLLRVTFRVGWAVANPYNRQQPTDASRYPFAVLRTPAV